MIAYSRFPSDSSNGNCPFEYNYICEQSGKSAKGFTAGKLIFHLFKYLFIDPDQLQEEQQQLWSQFALITKKVYICVYIYIHTNTHNNILDIQQKLLYC